MMTIEQLEGLDYSGDDPVIKKLYQQNARHLKDVLNGARNHSIIPFLGAGFSAEAYPLWRDLLQNWARDCGPAIESDVHAYLENGEYEEAASLVRREMGENTFRDEVRDTFGEDSLQGALDTISVERKGLPRAFQSCILTTNYDRLIEHIYFDFGTEIETVCPHEDYQRSHAESSLHRQDRVLFKLHGDAWDPAHAIMTKEDYDGYYGNKGNNAPLVNLMCRTFTGRQILFLGCSLSSDRTLKVLQSCCENTTHYALVELPQETENEVEPFSPKLVEPDGNQVPAYHKMRLNLDKLGIRPIWYPHGKHSALDTLLGWLESKIDIGGDCRNPDINLPKIPKSVYGVIGREDVVNDIIVSFSGEPSLTVVTGPGGIGKTEVCRESLRELRSDGHDIVYVVTTGLRTAWGQCDAIAGALGADLLPEREGALIETYVRHLLEYLNALERPIVYLDNSEDAWAAAISSGNRDPIILIEALRDSGVSVLVSSREMATEYSVDAKIVEVGRLSFNLTEQLFQTVFRRKHGQLTSDGRDYRTLIKNLDGHPLAVVLVATLAASASSWSEVLNRWPEASQIADDPRHNSLSAALKMSWDAVSDTPLAHELWGILTLTLGNLHNKELGELARISGTTKGAWSDAFARLRKASLVSLQRERISMLRPVREAFLYPADTRLANESTLERCFSWLERRETEIVCDGDLSMPAARAYDAHNYALATFPRALFLLRRALEHDRLGGEEAELANALTNFYQFDWLSSQPVLDILLKKAEQSDFEPIAALAAQELTECNLYYGKLDEAEKRCSQALKIHFQLRDYSGFGNDLRNYAAIFMARGNQETAELLLNKAVKLHQKVGDSFGLANAHNDLAEIAIQRNEYDKAEELLRLAEDGHKKVNDYLGCAYDIQCRAKLMNQVGEYREAVRNFEIAATLHKRAGDDYGLAGDIQGLAKLYLQFGKYDKAAECLTEAKELHQRCGDEPGLADDLRLQNIIHRYRNDTEALSRTTHLLNEILASINSHSGASRSSETSE